VLEEVFKYPHAEASPGFGKDAMIRYVFIQVITEKPSVGHINLNLPHQPSFRGNTIKVADEECLEEDNRVYGWLAGAAVIGSGQCINEGEIDGFMYLAKKMILRDKVVK